MATALELTASSRVPVGLWGVNTSVSTSQRVYDSLRLPLENSEHIRVISLRPSKTKDGSDPIVCDFRILDIGISLSLQDNNASWSTKAETRHVMPRYTAVSYTWGDANEKRLIELNGQPFAVQDNLWKFLHRARQGEFSGDLWIDALCIDQSTMKERNHQVSMMGEIYKRAEEVIVWLCPISKDAERAMRWGLAHETDARSLVHHRLGTASFPHFMPSDIGKLKEALTEFCTAAYWSRAWVVQEYVLAKDVKIWFGQTSMHEEDISWLFGNVWLGGMRVTMENTPAMKIVNFREAWLCRHPRADSPQGDLSEVEKEMDGRKHKVVQLERNEFINLLERFDGNLHCSEPLDGLYALLSLLSQTGRAELNIRPDYSKSTLDVLQEVIYWFREYPPKHWQEKVLESVDTVRRALRLSADDDAVIQLLQEANIGIPIIGRDEISYSRPEDW